MRIGPWVKPMIELRTRTVYSRDVIFSIMTVFEKSSTFPIVQFETFLSENSNSKIMNIKKSYQKI